MTTGQQARIRLVVGMMLMSAVAALTRVESQPSTQPRDAPSVFDGVVGNVAGSPELSTAELHAALAGQARWGKTTPTKHRLLFFNCTGAFWAGAHGVANDLFNSDIKTSADTN